MAAQANSTSSMPSSDTGGRLATLTLDDFTPCVGQVFRLAHEGGALEFLLLRADLTSARASQRAGFSLEFLGPGAPVLPQQTYGLEHSALGILEIFLVPLGRQEGGMRYEAVFG
jgi:hypothetical protein